MKKKSNFIGTRNDAGRAGFSLIELLIVIAIIGILATLLVANYIGVNQRSLDTVRKSNLSAIQSALELYRSDLGSYPLTADPNALSTCGGAFTGGSPVSTYMQEVPCDPRGPTYYNSGVYWYASDGAVYILGACLENDNDQQGTGTSPGGSGCASHWYYVRFNP